MGRYDEHMNRHGHYSILAQKELQRSPILDEILRGGGTLAGDYAERIAQPKIVQPKVAQPKIPSSDPSAVSVARGRPTKADPVVKDAAYYRDYRLRQKQAGIPT